MNARLTKEYRALRLPWLVGLAAGPAMLDHRTQDYAIVAAVGCVALLAAMSMGNEFQQRTFALLLSQPRARGALWREKLLILAALAGTAISMMFLSWRLAGSSHSDALDMVMTGIFCLAVVCSAPLWTLVARSIIGGMVFSLAGALLLLLLTVELGVDRILGPRFTSGVPDSVYAWAWLITGLVYSGGCLLAGWRKFAGMELKDAIFGESALLSTAATHKARWWNWLRIRPGGGLRNLVRKEMRLQRTGVVVAVVFSLCWVAAVGLPHPFGSRRDYEQLFCLMLMFVYIALSLALAGAISQGEERTLGLTAWHLTLPVSARVQWLVKLVVGVCVAIVLGLVLPGLLALATLPEARAGLADIAHGSASDMQGLLVYGTVSWLFFVLSFWAATLLGNTMRAVFTAVLGVGALVLCTLLSGWLAEQIGGLEKGILCEITSRWQLPLGFFHGHDVSPWELIAGGLVMSLVALAQSAVQFRRAQVQSAVVVKCAALLLAIVFLATFWCVDFQVSANRSYDAVLMREVSRALRALPPTQRGHSESTREVRITEMDLEKVFPLSARAKRWLTGASLYSSWFELESRKEPRRMERQSRVRIMFPNGNECSFGYGTWREGR
ncbi:MAG: hypothetical protein ACLQVX_11075 [Limisphaerales bacterium]